MQLTRTKKIPKSKSQSAMEYLMTYGWAILIIAVVLGVLFQLGVFSGSALTPRAQPGGCQVVRFAGQVSLEGECQGQLPQYVMSFNAVVPWWGFTVLSSSSLDTAWDGSSWTLSAWIFVNNSDGSIFLMGENAGCISGSYIVNQTSTGFSTTVDTWNGPAGNCGTGTVQQDYSSGLMPFNKWDFTLSTVHYSPSGNSWIAVCYNGHCSNETYTLSGPPSDYVGDYSEMEFGSNRCCGSGFDSGYIANVQLYNTSLSANEILALYQEGIGGTPIKLQNIVGWWPLNGNIQDYSGNNNNGQVQGNAAFNGSWQGDYTPP